MTDLTELRKSNAQRLAKLAQHGIDVNTLALGLGLDVLVRQLSAAKRAAFEETFERELEEHIVSLESQIARAVLQAGTQLSLADINRDKPLGG